MLFFAMIFSFLNSFLSFRSKAQVVVDDNCCLCHVAGVKYMSRMRNEDVLHASFRNHVFEVSILSSLLLVFSSRDFTYCGGTECGLKCDMMWKVLLLHVRQPLV